MEIQFSQQEIDHIRQFFDQVGSGEIGESTASSQPAWNTTFLLLRKLLAYGFHYVRQVDSTMSYQDLQRLTTKPDAMLTVVQLHLAVFQQLLVTYTTQQERA
ncbi:hypothetical protein GCM10028817_14670 [Spirosoma pomorum]